MTLAQFSVEERGIEMPNATFRLDHTDDFKVELPNGVRVVYKRVSGVEVPFIYDERFRKAKSMTSEAVRMQLRWDSSIGVAS